jgi:hypothetical protein
MSKSRGEADEDQIQKRVRVQQRNRANAADGKNVPKKANIY